ALRGPGPGGRDHGRSLSPQHHLVRGPGQRAALAAGWPAAQGPGNQLREVVDPRGPREDRLEPEEGRPAPGRQRHDPQREAQAPQDQDPIARVHVSRGVALTCIPLVDKVDRSRAEDAGVRKLSGETFLEPADSYHTRREAYA